MSWQNAGKIDEASSNDSKPSYDFQCSISVALLSPDHIYTVKIDFILVTSSSIPIFFRFKSFSLPLRLFWSCGLTALRYSCAISCLGHKTKP